MGKLRLMLAFMALSPAVFAQSAENFDAKITPPNPPGEKSDKPLKKAAKEAGPVSNTPSRFIGSTEKEAYLESLSSVFLIGSRERDPFGQAQDPDAKPIIKKPPPGVIKPRAGPAPVTPFSDIVGMLPVTTIMPGEKRFLVGTRSFKVGDQLALTLRGKQFQVLVTGVSSQEIAFRNLESGETAKRKLDLLPPGMRAGHGVINAPGMVPEHANAPIQLEGGDSTPDPVFQPPNDP